MYFNMEGWTKLHRKFLSWEWFDISDMVKLFIFLLLSANHTDGIWRGIEIKRGQYLTGLNSLNEKTKISIQTLRTCLKRLEKTGEINMQVTNKYRLITICKYESYQDTQQATNKLPNKQLTSNQQATNSKQEEREYKNVNKEQYIYNQFYDEQLKLSSNDPDYKLYIDFLFGKNILKQKLTGVLSITNQITFEQFEKLLSIFSKSDKTIRETLLQMENDKKYYKGKTELFTTLSNWGNNRFKK